MSTYASANPTPPDVSLKAVSAYFIALATLFVSSLVWSWLEKPLFFAMAAALPVALVVVTNPRIALYQFVFTLFIVFTVIDSIPLLLIEVSAVLVILAAVIDLLLRVEKPRPLPRLTLNYVLILAALLVSGLMGYDPTRAIRPMVRVVFLLITFLSVFRLLRYVDVHQVLRFFFGFCVLHSLISLSQFVVSGGGMRVFGLAFIVFDDLTMLALPIGMSLFLWGPRGKGLFYLLGSLIVAAALVTTQSRAPIIIGFFATFLSLVISCRRAGRFGRHLSAQTTKSRLIHRRALLVASLFTVLAVALVVSQGAVQMFFGRFERLITLEPGGTFLLRITMWKMALRSFWDHPLFGIGPGVFRSIYEVYTTIHLDPTYIWIRGKSAHSLLLHYMAETGLVGASALLALFFNQFRFARRQWLEGVNESDFGPALALYLVGILLLLTSIVEAGWMWGHTGFICVFFLALIARKK